MMFDLSLPTKFRKIEAKQLSQNRKDKGKISSPGPIPKAQNLRGLGKVSNFQHGPIYLSIKKNSGGQQEEGHGVVHHLQQEHYQSIKEGSHKKVQKVRMVHPTCP